MNGFSTFVLFVGSFFKLHKNESTKYTKHTKYTNKTDNS